MVVGVDVAIRKVGAIYEDFIRRWKEWHITAAMNCDIMLIMFAAESMTC